MSSTTLLTRALILLAVAGAAGCDDKAEPSATATSSAAPTASAPAPSAPAPSAPAPTASAPAPSVPLHDCPAGSSGDASLAKPCDAKGGARMMEVTWTGKMTDTGPSFRVVNKSPSVILYGKMVAYFYDKAGKQLDVKDAGGKAHPHHTCSGNLFGGVMKPAEKAVITFSCVKKDTVPEGTDKIEAEIEVVGFADASEKKSEWFWRNKDLTPDARAKGGVK
jgi:pyruvate/2-oxoglutarate dehydrogenase complex dihydrolipoamide acyltransferase (E2) component